MRFTEEPMWALPYAYSRLTPDWRVMVGTYDMEDLTKVVLANKNDLACFGWPLGRPAGVQ